MKNSIKNNHTRIVRLFFVTVAFFASFYMHAKNGDLIDASKTLLSAASFHLTLFGNDLWYRNGCTFDVICWPGETARVEYNSNGAIVAMCDGKKTPLLLGSIPRKTKHLHALRKKLNLPNSATIELFTLAREFECDWAGLSELIIASGGLVTQYNYPTTDFSVPTLTTLVCAIHDLRTRDQRKGRVAYVHCKGGKRSATVIAAYLITVLHDLGVASTSEEIELFVKSCRPQIKFGAAEKKLLIQFQVALQNAENFEALYAQYA